MSSHSNHKEQVKVTWRTETMPAMRSQSSSRILAFTLLAHCGLASSSSTTLFSLTNLEVKGEGDPGQIGQDLKRQKKRQDKMRHDTKAANDEAPVEHGVARVPARLHVLQQHERPAVLILGLQHMGQK